MPLRIFASRVARVLVTLGALSSGACSELPPSPGVKGNEHGFDASRPEEAGPSHSPMREDAGPEAGDDAGPPTDGSDLILDVSGGRIEGTRDGETRLFFGIPYGKP